MSRLWCRATVRTRCWAKRSCSPGSPSAHGERVPVHLCVYLARERRRSPGRCVFRPGGAPACAGAAKPRTRRARRRAPCTAAPGDARASAGVFVCRVFCPAGFGVRDERWSYCRRAHARVFSAARVFDRGHGVWHRVSASVQFSNYLCRCYIQEFGYDNMPCDILCEYNPTIFTLFYVIVILCLVLSQVYFFL